MDITKPNEFDSEIEDKDYLKNVSKMLIDLSNYNSIKPLQRALIPEDRELYGISVYKDGSLACESSLAYAVT